jgi:adenine-specific DNA-methyltransferase
MLKSALSDLPRIPASSIAALHARCGVYTRPSIVARVLDSVGWIASADLSRATLLEPAVGDGEFLVEAADRLLLSLARHDKPSRARLLGKRILAFEIHAGAARLARARIRAVLESRGIDKPASSTLARQWIRTADFLLWGGKRRFSHVVGNPPYVRWSKIPTKIRKRYERFLPPELCRGDLFLPFLDNAIEYLEKEGCLGFVCSDRWQYAAFAANFRSNRLQEVVIESNNPISASHAYSRDVDTYPSILLLRKPKTRVSEIKSPMVGKKQTLAERNCEIRVGPALGCTPAFVVDATTNIEKELLHPWLDTRDVSEGDVSWSGRYVLLTHDEFGNARDLTRYPNAKKHLMKFKVELERRAIVKQGASWHRPIDRVISSVWSGPKLLIPEIAKVPRIAYDTSSAIPSHGLYAIIGEENELAELYKVLRDGGLARALENLAPRIKGGYFRCYKRILAQIVLD